MMNILDEIAERIRNAIRLIPDPDARGKEICMGMDGTPTTQIDKIAENTVLSYLQENNIELNVLSEEIGFVDNGYKDTLVLDPIDGTTNSVIGVPLYTVSMAIGKRSLKDVHTAFIKNLVTGDTYTAEKGKGAYLNGKRIRTKKRSDPNKMLMMIYMGNGSHPDSFALAKRVKSSRAYGCASIEMVLVATGAADGFLMNAENNRRSIRVIDIAASYLILKEAGGDIFHLDGTEFDMPFDLDHRANFLAVGNKDVYDIVMFGRNGKYGSKYRYGIYANMSLPNSVDVTKRVLNALGDEKIILEKEIADALGMKGKRIDKMDIDILITVGGDGTILRGMQKNNASIFGVNAGGVGFLAEIPTEKIEEGIARLKEGNYRIDERLKLQTTFNGKRMADAVNEAVIHTDSVAKIRQFRVYVDDHLATDIRADGIIIATPTGSTCYAMSVGSPIIDPRVNALVMVPMAAFKFAARPIVIPTSSKITVELVDKSCLLVIDGQEEYGIPRSSKLEFSMSSDYGRFIRFDDDFYSRIHEKLESGL